MLALLILEDWVLKTEGALSGQVWPEDGFRDLDLRLLVYGLGFEV